MSTDHKPEETDAQIADRLNSFDPVADVPSPVKIMGDVRVTAEPSMSMLSPEMRQSAEAKLANGPRSPEAISRAVEETLRENSREVRIRAGAGEGATETQRTMLQHANQVRLLNEEAERIDAALAEVTGYSNGFDKDGNPQAVPVYRSRGDNRLAMEARRNEVVREMALIAGIQGERELQEATTADIAQMKETRRQIDEMREADALADKMASEARVKKLAEAKLKSRTAHLG